MNRTNQPEWSKPLLRGRPFHSALDLLAEQGVHCTDNRVYAWRERGGLYGVQIPIIGTDSKFPKYLSTADAIEEWVTRAMAAGRAKGLEDAFAAFRVEEECDAD